MIPYGRQAIDKDDIDAVSQVLNSDYLTTGPEVGEFEQKFAKFVGAKYAVAVSNGTAGLHLACLAAGLTKGSELITTPITFAASANCALYCGAKPIFVDVKKENGLINEDLIEERITSKTKIIIPVHLGGLPCNMKRIRDIAVKHKLTVIEDACHALGSKYLGTKVGDCKYSDMSVFSFHPVKHITTGEGGMITTNSKKLYEKLILLRSHGITRKSGELITKDEGLWFYEMQELGFNYRLTDFQCALGISQLAKVNKFIAKRIEVAKRYDIAFGDINGIEIINPPDGLKNTYHLYIIKTKDKETRLKLFNHLKENGILCQVHYIPVYWHPYYQKLGYKKGICPIAEDFYDRIISIPIFFNLKNSEQIRVINTIEQFMSQKRILAIIPARGGSKRIPRKNIKNFLGKPIISYAIKAALDSKIFDEVMVSTDDKEISDVAEKFGAKVPFLRSAKNSGDHSTTADVIEEVLSEYQKQGGVYNYACCIYPTAPFVTENNLKKALDLMIKNNADSVLPVIPFEFPIQRSFSINGSGSLKINSPKDMKKRTQDLAVQYHDAGQFYFFNVKSFMKSKYLFMEKTYPLILNMTEAQDIDNPDDWTIAELKYKILTEKYGRT